ncbi:serine hydrolase domain-containing protein [Microbulbifer marinus]|uniref:CubicO group peptidase, beta-lactamase class C family n=1 Tax=Microbulbifer marinus TaxID=658218 RepID=A0A1H3Z945_9GAMM|nr:serine hydrolase [Microbulbifer marinus]SEA20269.1 CubicO group peptidase, beta-lactamase class C family [Microbulbifer marinus]
MKKTITLLLGSAAALLLALALLAPSLLGFSITQLGSAVRVATGMGAKLACSARFVSGFDEARIVDDLASYSPANRLLDLHYADKRVSAALLGMGRTSASYRDGLGCTLDIGDTSTLDQVQVQPVLTNGDEWPLGSSVSSIDANLQQRVEAIVARDNAAGLQTRALVVVQDGKLLAEAYGPGIDAETPLLGWSMGKSLTAMMLGRMEALGLANSQSKPVFAAWARDARAQIALEDLLRMSSGLDFDETYAPGSDATKMLFNAHSASDVAMVSPAMYEPGQHFSYSSGTTNLLARWMHEQLGGDVQASLDFFSREILQPLGMAHTVFEVDPSGVFVGSSYIYASGRDWARLGQLMLNRGEWRGEQLLGADWVARAAAPNPSANEPRYGYQFWLNGGGDALRYPQLPADAYFMSGNRKQVVMISPSTNTVVVHLGWSAGGYPTGENFAELLPGA